MFLTVTKLWVPRQRLSLQSLLPLHWRNHLLRGSSGSPPQCGGKYPKTLPGSHRRCKVVRCSFVFTHSCRLLLVLNEWIKSLFLAVNKLFSLKTYGTYFNTEFMIIDVYFVNFFLGQGYLLWLEVIFINSWGLWTKINFDNTIRTCKYQ